MRYLLTSNICDDHGQYLREENGLLDRLHTDDGYRNALFICSNPTFYDMTEDYARMVFGCFAASGIPVARYSLLDARNQAEAAALIGAADLIILAGGHVPTQNRFFRDIGLRSLIRGTSGLIIGISAGSMNAAEVVYAAPEEPGEALSPTYNRFLLGLGLTRTMLLPHYQHIRHGSLDGLRMMEDIVFPDSMGRTFYALPDGSFLAGTDAGETICGEAYLIRDGKAEPFGTPGTGSVPVDSKTQETGNRNG